MKKKKPNEPKPKGFSASPFAALKGVKVEAPAPPPPPKPEPVAKRLAELDDSDAFLLAMEGVQRLGEKRQPAAGKAVGRGARPGPVKPLVRRIDEQEQQVFLEAVAGLKLDVTFGDGDKDEPAPKAPRTLSRLKQLRRGTIRLDYELDLHGLARDEALDALAAFVQGACRRGQQAVLVITGQEGHSADEPVLSDAVDAWLKEEGAEMVAELLPAPREFGGVGAVVVFLKEPSETAAGRY